MCLSARDHATDLCFYLSIYLDKADFLLRRLITFLLKHKNE